MHRIEFGELRINDISKKHLRECVDTNWVTMGPKVELFEKKWATLFNYPHTRMLSSGTSANTACCMALYEINGAKPGSEVIVPALSFIASATAIRAAGLTPRFVDVRVEDLQIDVDKVEQAINKNTVAIMAVNLMGKTCNLEALRDLCDHYKLTLIIDNCEAYGAQRNDQFSLSYGDFETTSHYTAHICQACEGGTVSTNDEYLDQLIAAIRNHGRYDSQYFQHDIWGMNFKPTDLHASIGLGQVAEFWENFDRRTWILNALQSQIAHHSDKFLTTEERPSDINAPHALSITLRRAGKIGGLIKSLEDANIAWKRNFGSIPTQHGVFGYLGHQLGDFPNAEWIGDNGIHIGVHRYMTDEDVGRVAATLDNFLGTL